MVCLAYLLLIAPAAVSAQTVTGVVRDESAAPVSGAAVLAFRADSLVGRAVTGGDGAYRITLDRGGVLRIRFERLGYGTTEVAAQVDSASVTRVDVTVSTAPLEVAGVVAEVRRACREPESPRALAELWLEARDILEALRSPPDPGRDSVPVLVTRRDLGPRGRIVHAEAVDTVWTRAGAPMGASVPMSDEGLRFVDVAGDSAVYFAPDARTLLSDRFLATHCFGMGPAGLTFEPLPEQREPDIRGVFAVPAAGERTATLEFRFTAHPWDVPADDVFGGRVEMVRSAEGGWSVRAWNMVVPRGLRDSSGTPLVERRAWSAEVVELGAPPSVDAPACAGVAGTWALLPDASEYLRDALLRIRTSGATRAIEAATTVLDVAPSFELAFEGGAAVLTPEGLAPKQVPLDSGALTLTTGVDDIDLSATCDGDALVVQRVRSDGLQAEERYRLAPDGRRLELRRALTWTGLARPTHFTQWFTRAAGPAGPTASPSPPAIP